MTIHSSGQTISTFSHRRHHSGCRYMRLLKSGLGVDGTGEVVDKASERQAAGLICCRDSSVEGVKEGKQIQGRRIRKQIIMIFFENMFQNVDTRMADGNLGERGDKESVLSWVLENLTWVEGERVTMRSKSRGD